MVIHLLACLYVSIFVEWVPFFWDILEDTIFASGPFRLFCFFVFFLVNNYICTWQENNHNNEDMLCAFFRFLYRAVSIFITLAFSRIKMYYYHLRHFKFRASLRTHMSLVFMTLGTLHLIWRPIFRKWSYFGFYKTNRSKWWKNK